MHEKAAKGEEEEEDVEDSRGCIKRFNFNTHSRGS
jgi:hypothetical protein